MIKVFILLLSVLVVDGASAATLFNRDKHYNANWSVRTRDYRFEGKLYRSHLKERREYSALGIRHVLIIREDRGYGYYFDSKHREAYKLPSEAIRRFLGDFSAHISSRDNQGRSRMQGEDMRVFQVHGDLSTDRTQASYPIEGKIWVDSAGIERRSELTVRGSGMRINVVSEITHVQRGRQPSPLFELPDNYTVNEDASYNRTNNVLQLIRGAFN